MQLMGGLLLALALSSGVASASSTGTSSRSAGLGKVIQMLTDMTSAAKKEKQEEEVAFATFSTWCAEESASLKNEIAKDAQEIEGLAASSAKLRSDAKVLGEEVAKLDASVEGFEAEKKQQDEQRDKDNKEFLAVSQDYSESIDALDRALVRLQKESYDRPAAASAVLAQLSSARTPLGGSAISTLQALARGEEPAGLAYDAPEANAYEPQSGGIIGVLEKLKDTFRSKLGDAQKQEMNGKHAYDMIVQDLVDSIASAKKDISEKTVEKERKLEAAEADEAQMTGTESVKAENEKTLAEMTTECQEKVLSFQEKQQLRGEEIEAMGKAVEILSSPEVAGSYDKHLSFTQGATRATALVQSHSSKAAGVRREIRRLLEKDGQRLHSQRLALLAARIAADPFSKVKSMIEGMITRLLEEANGDADHEGFCDTEMGKSKLTRTKLSEDIDGLSAEIDEGKSKILTLTEEIASLTNGVSSLQKALAEGADMRTQEKTANAATVKEAKEAQQAVTAATAVLKDFYAKALQTTAFVQKPSMGSDEWNSLANPDFKGTVDKGHKEGMQTFGDAYKGQQNQAGGVLALMEVILSDFATLEADTAAAEASSAKAHKDFKVTSERSLATKQRQIEMSGTDKTKAEAKLQSDTQELKATQDQLLAADRYHEKLVPQCVDQGMTFEERTKAREAEIASLKEALKLLSSPDVETSVL